MADFIGKSVFFKEPSQKIVRDKIKELTHVDGDRTDILNAIKILDPREVLCIDSLVSEEKKPIIPEEHYVNAMGGPYRLDGPPGNASWHFLRHGNEASMTQMRSRGDLDKKVRDFSRKREHVVPGHIQSQNLRNSFYFLVSQTADAYERAIERGKALSGYTFKPVTGNDRRIRKVSLIELLEASWLDVYSLQAERLNIRFGTLLGKARATKTQGAIVQVDYVPSRSGKKPYKFDLRSVPVNNNLHRHEIAYSINSTLDDQMEGRNLTRQFGDTRSRSRKSEDRKYFVAHEIAAYWNFMRKFGKMSAEEIRQYDHRDHINFGFARIVPLEMSQFRIPTQETIDFYLTMLDNVVLATKQDNGRIGYRKLVKAEQEILLSEYVGSHTHGIWDTFYLPGTRNMTELKWFDRPTRRAS
jgi:hypothetical protein